MMQDYSLLIDLSLKYEKLPSWQRWVFFLPISILISITFGFIYKLFITYAFSPQSIEDDPSISISLFVFEVLHPVIFQFIFLTLIYFTVPIGKLKWVMGLIILRSVVLLFFIPPIIYTIQHMFDFMGESFKFRVINPNVYDLDFFKSLTGEILTLIVSIKLYKLLKE